MFTIVKYDNDLREFIPVGQDYDRSQLERLLVVSADRQKIVDNGTKIAESRDSNNTKSLEQTQIRISKMIKDLKDQNNQQNLTNSDNNK